MADDMKIDHNALALLPFELRAEIAENLYRKDWTPSEIDAIRRRCQEVLMAQAKERQREHGGTAPGKHSAKISPSDGGRAVNKIGAFAGISGRTIEKIAAVVTAAEREPDRFGPVSAVLRRAKVDARVTVKVATPPKGAGRARGFRERYALPAIDNGEPHEAFRTLESLVRQTLISADDEAKIDALGANLPRQRGRRDQAKAKASRD
jgi:hypothetical protein